MGLTFLEEKEGCSFPKAYKTDNKAREMKDKVLNKGLEDLSYFLKSAIGYL